MYTPFENLTEDAKIWVYQMNRSLKPEEEQSISEDLRQFLDSWNAHQQPLKCSGKIFYHQFLVLAVDENFNQVSGCSIDKSVDFLHQLSDKYNVDLFERNLIAFLENEQVRLEPLMELKEKIREGDIQFEAITFNNLIKTKKELKNNWLIPAGESWMKRYYKIVK